MAQTAKKIDFPVQDELQSEYVSGGGWFNNVRLSLDGYDHNRPGLNAETRAALRYDSEVESSVEFVIDSVFAEGVQPLPRLTDKDDPEFEKAVEIADFNRKATDHAGMPRSLTSVLEEVFRDAFYSGVKCAEIVLAPDDDNNLILSRLNPKPNSAVSFVCDKFYNVLGLAGWQRFDGDLKNKLDEIIPREKFLIQQFELEDNNPVGVSKVRCIYDDFIDKKCDRPVYKEWKRTSAIPKKFGTTAEKAPDVKVRNPDGSYVIENGVPKTVSAQKALSDSLEGFANNSTVTAPHGTDVKQFEVTGDGEQFIKSLKFNNSGIRKGILGDSVTTGEDDKGVKAAKEVANDVVDLKIISRKKDVCETVERDLYRLLTVLNFGAEFAHLTPICSLGDTERRNWAADGKAAAAMGYQFAPEHLPEIDAMFSVKPRKEMTQIKPESPVQTDDEETEDE